LDANNTHQVFDWLWTSGQLSEKDILQLASLGFDVVINLALPSTPNALRGEAELVTGQGLVYVQIPVGWEDPQFEQFSQFAGLMKAFSGRKIWVHCAKNMRVSAFVYLYRKLVLGDSELDAALLLHKIWSPNEIWQAFIQQVIAAYPNVEDR
jgi:protein tyrosine phosphatase (PTP) superfamily phosphohydrolase (DUF442 family)